MDIEMPQLGETVTEGTITKWLKAVGDSVAVDEPLFEVSTDKVDSEVPSPVAGTLSEIIANEGDTIDVGSVVAKVSEGAVAEAPVAAEPEAPAATQQEVATSPEIQNDEPEFVAPAEVTAPAAAVAESSSEAKVMSPIVRKMIRENNLNESQIVGTGIGGKITKADVESILSNQSATATAPAAPAAASQPAASQQAQPAAAPIVMSPPPVVAAPAVSTAVVPSVSNSVDSMQGGEIIIPFDNIRRRTAEHMVMSKATSAHVYTSVEVDFEKVQQVREAYGPQWKATEGFSLTYLPFIVRAVSEAVREFPHVNASIKDDCLVVHRDLHMSIAVDINFQGLIAPVVKHADGKRVRLISREIRSLADRAKSKQLRPDEILGGTFTITNPGPFGSHLTLPIINQPQVAILATDGIKKRPVVVQGPSGEDLIAIHHMGNIVLAWDHRAFDGAYASAFMDRIRFIIENADWEKEVQ